MAALRLRGTLKAEWGDLTGALADFQAALAVDIADAATYVARAEAYARHDQRELALEDCGNALVLDPENAAALRLRARLGGQ